MATLGCFVFTAFLGDCLELILFCNRFLFVSLSIIRQTGPQKKHLTKKGLSVCVKCVCAATSLNNNTGVRYLNLFSIW